MHIALALRLKIIGEHLRKIDLMPRHHGARFGFFKNPSIKIEKSIYM
jgi:hypothetical protein